MSVEPQLTKLEQGNGYDDGVRQYHTVLVPDASIDDRSSLPAAPPMISSQAPEDNCSTMCPPCASSLLFSKKNCKVSMSSEAKNCWQPIPEKYLEPAVQIGPVKNVALLSVTTYRPPRATSIVAVYLRLLSVSGTTAHPEPILSVRVYEPTIELLPGFGPVVAGGGESVVGACGWPSHAA